MGNSPARVASGSNYANFTFQVQDNGGTANGSVDLSPFGQDNGRQRDVGQQRADPLGTNNLSPILMNDSSNAGTLVSALIAGQVFDHDGPPAGIAVVAVDNSHGTWQYSVDGGSQWAAIGAVALRSALLLAADANTLVRFVPAANWTGSVPAGLTFHAWDQTSGTAGSTADATSNGGSTAFSTAIAASGILVNNAPVVLNGANNLASIQVNQFNNVGTPVAALLTGQVIEASPTATVGIAVVGVNNSNGVWQYSLNGGQSWLTSELRRRRRPVVARHAGDAACASCPPPIGRARSPAASRFELGTRPAAWPERSLTRPLAAARPLSAPRRLPRALR